MPAAAGLHLPKPSQPPAMQFAIDAGQVLSAAPAGLLVQVPGDPLTLHAWQLPHDGMLQHVLSTQLPEVHWLAAVQGDPFDCGATQVPPVQNAVPVQVVPLQQSCPTPPQRHTLLVSHVRLAPHLLDPLQQG